MIVSPMLLSSETERVLSIADDDLRHQTFLLRWLNLIFQALRKARKPLPDAEEKDFDDDQHKVSDLLSNSFITM